MPNRILVVDDHPLMRDAIQTILSSLAAEGRVDAVASLTEAMQRLASDPSYDLALLDLRLPDAAGFEGLKTLRSRFPACPTVVMSGELDGRTILHCLELGAAGYIPKTLHGEGITNALRVVASGDVYRPAAGRRRAGLPCARLRAARQHRSTCTRAHRSADRRAAPDPAGVCPTS
jgi:DNA-binding NarL/FixJ family response regulator